MLFRRPGPVRYCDAMRPFLDAVAREVGRIGREEFGWPDDDLQRLEEVIASGDEAQVCKAEVITVRGEEPGTARVVFFAPEEIAQVEREIADGQVEVLERVSLIEIVEATAFALHATMVAAGVKFHKAH